MIDKPPPDPIDFPRVHRELLKGLRSVDEACRLLGIEYWIDAGTLLGAVRLGDFIPWDDDVDLCMRRDQLDRFLNEAPAILGSEYFVVARSEDPVIGSDAKVYVRGSHVVSPEQTVSGIPAPRSDALFIDIFIADSLSRYRLVRRTERVIAWAVTTHPWASILARSDRLGARARFKWRIASAIPAFAIKRLEKSLTRRGQRRRPDLLGVGIAAVYNGFPYPRRVILPLSEVEFAGSSFPAPADPDSYLRSYYDADYLTPPPPDKRITHAESVRFEDNQEVVDPTEGS